MFFQEQQNVPSVGPIHILNNNLPCCQNRGNLPRPRVKCTFTSGRAHIRNTKYRHRYKSSVERHKCRCAISRDLRRRLFLLFALESESMALWRRKRKLEISRALRSELVSLLLLANESPCPRRREMESFIYPASKQARLPRQKCILCLR